ncbi:MAG: EamA family transporter, partial [Mucinivorans sp.]
AGIATAVHFLYPVCVVLLMTLFFGERASVKNFGAVILAVIGVAVLSSAESGLSHSTSTQGIIIVIISSLAYAIYIIGVKKMNIGTLSDFKLSFYVISTTALMFLIKATLMVDGITVVQNATQTTNIILLALIPTVLSNFALIKAIKSVGSTTTSILGALEPMTAVTIGVLVFNEHTSTSHIIGIILIIGAVITIILKRTDFTIKKKLF